MVFEASGTLSGFGDRLYAAARRVAEGTSGAIALTRKPVVGGAWPPQLTLHLGGREAICYRAVPEGPEEAPFLDALLALAGASGATIPPVPEHEIRILVFISPECPNCPVTVRAATTIAAVNRHVGVTVIDATEFGDEAAAVGVRSVPMTVVDDALTLVGAINAEDLAGKIFSARGPEGDGAVFVSLIDSGRFAVAAERLGTDAARRAYVERWRSSSFESRIGLMLTADEALAGERAAMDGLVPDLLAFVEADDPALRGDTADLLGRIGDPRARPALEELCKDTVDEVVEAAKDALDEMSERRME
jgi:hypothetical protein